MSDNAKTQARLAKIGQKGWEVAQKLHEVKANQNADLRVLGRLFKDDTDEPPEERLRRYLDMINAARERQNGGDYGNCLNCGKAFSDAELDEMPWVDLCNRCAANA